MAKGRKVKVVNGLGKFTGANTLEVEGENGKTVINFDNAIIAAVSVRSNCRLFRMRSARVGFHRCTGTENCS